MALTRRLAFGVILVLGCAGTPEDTDPPGETGINDSGTDTGSPVVRPVLASPAEAPDLDDDPGVVRVELTASPHTHVVGDREIAGYAYNGQTPGPTIRAKLGDHVIVDFTNDLDAATTIHWHGLHVPYAMDGVTWTTSPIAPGDTFQYAFTVEQTGTFWYHPHFDTERQVDLGLYGVLVVEDPADPPVDEELIVVFDSWDEGSTDAVHDHREGTELGWAANLLEGAVFSPVAGATVRIRVLNASNTGYLDLRDVAVIARDQGLLSARPATGGAILAPGDRVDLELLPGPDPVELTTWPYSLHGGPTFGDPTPLFAIEPTGTKPPAAPPPWPFPGGSVTPDPTYTDIVYVLQGDTDADRWMINGEVFPDVTVEALDHDTTAIIEVRNLSPTEHPFHLHGHAFEVLSIDGAAPAQRTVEDTLNIGIRQAVRLRLEANNPGFWMTHCHILPHAEGGMMTVLQVRNPE